MKNLVLAAGFAVLSTVAAQAATITNLGDGQVAYNQVDTSTGTFLAAGLSFDAEIVTGSVSGSRSPYDDSGFASVSGFDQLDYFSIGPSWSASPATLAIAGGSNMLKFLWGSIDGYNSVALYAGATLLDTILNTDIAPSSGEPGGLGASYVSIYSDARFDSAVFMSSGNAFEIANISAVPLPAGALLLLTAIGGLGAASRRRKAKS